MLLHILRKIRGTKKVNLGFRASRQPSDKAGNLIRSITPPAKRTWAIRGVLVSKSSKGVFCVLAPWELEDTNRGVAPDCRNHRHVSKRRAFDRTGDVRFASRTLASVFASRGELIGFIVEVGGRARWALHHGENWKGPINKLHPGCWATINAYLNQYQTLIDSKQATPSVINLDWQGTKGRLLPRNAAISDALRGYSPCAITATDSIANAEGAVAARRAKRNR